MQKCQVYELKVETTNALETVFKDANGNYRDANDGIIYIVTNDLTRAIKTIGEDNIRSIKKLGIGYIVG